MNGMDVLAVILVKGVDFIMWPAIIILIIFFITLTVSEYNSIKQSRIAHEAYCQELRIAYEAYCNACIKTNQKPQTIQEFNRTDEEV